MADIQTIVDSLKRIKVLQEPFSESTFIEWLKHTPVLDQMNESINLFNSISRESPNIFQDHNLTNSYQFSVSLSGRSLPNIKDFVQKLTANPDSLERTLRKISEFEFIESMSNRSTMLFYSCLIEIYSIFLCEQDSSYCVDGATITQVVEEMLALKAINGNPTELFFAIKPWILDYETEGFSARLADAIRNID